MKSKSIFIIFIIFFMSCVTSDGYYSVGTTGAVYELQPYPTPELWKEYLDYMNQGFNKQSEKTILWGTGSYYSSGTKLSFPGSDSPIDGIYFSDVDYNEEFFTYFDKNDISVFLLIEPGTANVAQLISLLLNRYSNHKSVVGICIDLEWYSNEEDGYLSNKECRRLLTIVKSYNNEYLLMLKHWNIKKIEPTFDDGLIYIQTMDGVLSIENIIKRHEVWLRTFYPSHVGMEIGFSSNKILLDDYENPIYELSKKIKDVSNNRASIYWSDTTLYDYIDYLETRKQ